jgi:hypothetical protein
MGAVAVILTVATVATLSVKDTVQAGTKAAMQRELQQLNTALNNFEAAGGVITPGMDTVEEVIEALKGGVDLAGGTFDPLATDPALRVSMDGDTYELGYTPEEGFAYSPASGTGDPITGAGEMGVASGTYPFDVTSAGSVREAADYFAGLDSTDPARQSYVDAFNAARNFLGEEDLKEIGNIITGNGVYTIGNEWTLPSPDYQILALDDGIWERMARLMYSHESFEEGRAEQEAAAAGGWENLIKNWYTHPGSRYRSHLTSNLLPAALNQEETQVGRFSGVVTPELFGALPGDNADWAAATAQFAGEDGWKKYLVMDSVAMITRYRELNNEPHGESMTLPRSWIRNVDWTKVPSGQGFNFDRDDLSGLNLTGFSPQGVSFWATNLTGAKGLTAEGLAQTISLASVNLAGTGITKESLRQALVAAGKTPGSWNPEFNWNGSNSPETPSMFGEIHFNLDTITFDDAPPLNPWASPTPTPRPSP